MLNTYLSLASIPSMKKLLLITLAVLSGGLIDSAQGAGAAATPAAQTQALLASATDVQVNQLYSARCHRHRRYVIVGHRTRRVVFYRHGIRYVEYRRVPVYGWRWYY